MPFKRHAFPFKLLALERAELAEHLVLPGLLQRDVEILQPLFFEGGKVDAVLRGDLGKQAFRVLAFASDAAIGKLLHLSQPIKYLLACHFATLPFLRFQHSQANVESCVVLSEKNGPLPQVPIANLAYIQWSQVRHLRQSNLLIISLMIFICPLSLVGYQAPPFPMTVPTGS